MKHHSKYLRFSSHQCLYLFVFHLLLLFINRSSDSVPTQGDITQMLEFSSNCNILLAIVDNMNEVFFYEIKNLKSNDWTSPATIVQ